MGTRRKYVGSVGPKVEVGTDGLLTKAAVDKVRAVIESGNEDQIEGLVAMASQKHVVRGDTIVMRSIITIEVVVI